MVDEQNGVRVVIFRDGDGWVAQCLDYDIFAQGVDVKTVQGRIVDTLHADLNESLRRNRSPFAGLPPAPEWASDMWRDEKDPFIFRGMIPMKNEQKAMPYELALCA